MRTRNVMWVFAGVVALVIGAVFASIELPLLSAQQSVTGALLFVGYGAVVLWWHVRPLLSGFMARIEARVRRNRAASHA